MKYINVGLLNLDVSNNAAIEFIKWHYGTASPFTDDVYKTFRELITQGKDVAVVKEYREISGCSMEQAHFAVKYAESLES